MGYRATKHKDGTFTLHGVPIFLEHEKDTGEGVKLVDRKWLHAAWKKNAARIAQGYAPPVHVEHSVDALGRPQKTKHAGRFVIRRLGTRTYDGCKRGCLIADLQRIPAHVYREIKAGRLPYLSVEVHDLDEPEIDSIALMESTVPFFRLPSLDVAEEVPEGQGKGRMIAPTYQAGRRPAICYRAHGRRAAVLYQFDGGPPVDGLMEKLVAGITAGLAPLVEEIEAMKGGGATPDPAAMVGPGVPADEEMPGAADLPLGSGEEMADEGDAAEVEGENLEESGEVLDAEADAVEAIEGDDEDEEMYMASDDDDDDEMYCDDGPAGKGGAPASKKGGAVGYSAALAEARAEIASLKGQIAADRRQRRQREAIELSERELSDLGILTPEISQDIRTFAAEGPRALTAYMSAQRKAAPHLPPTSWSGEQQIPAHMAEAAKSQPALATYAAKGPETLKRALQLGAEYDEWAKRGRAPRGGREAFISMNIGRTTGGEA